MSKENLFFDEYQEIDFNEDYIKNSKNQLDNIQTIIKRILEQSSQLKKQIINYFSNFETQFTNLLKEIETCLIWFKNTKNFNEKKDENIQENRNFLKSIHEYFNKCNESIKEIKENEYEEKINEYNTNLKNIIKDIIDELRFNPPKSGEINPCNGIIKLAFSNIDISTSDSEEPFESNFTKNSIDFSELEKEFSYIKTDKVNTNKEIITNSQKKKSYKEERENKNNTNTNNNSLKCSGCGDEANNICTHCNKLYCISCSEYFENYGDCQNHKLVEIPDNLKNREKLKNSFLQNFMELVKYYLLKCNVILTIKSTDFQFPSIEKIYELESQKEYLEQINEICEKYGKVNNNSNDDNDEEVKTDNNIDGRIINYLEKICGKKCHFSKDVNDIDDDFYTDNKNKNKNDEEEEDDELDKIDKDFLLFITIVAKENIVLNLDISKIIEAISKKLKIEKKDIFILLNDNVNNFVKSKEFFSSYNQNQHENHIFNLIKEIKILTKYLLFKECQISLDNFDCKGNCVNPNSSCNIIRGTEIYDPPYGWLGIGLNVEGKYDNGNNDWLNNNTSSSKWAIAYHGISTKLSSDKIKKLLNYIITNNGIKKLISKMKSNSNDKRHSKKVGEGIYLCPQLKIAEKYTGIITFNDKRYKVLLMAKVYIDEIREPENTNFWVLDEKYIRIYRVLFKEIS